MKSRIFSFLLIFVFIFSVPQNAEAMLKLLGGIVGGLILSGSVKKASNSIRSISESIRGFPSDLKKNLSKLATQLDDIADKRLKQAKAYSKESIEKARKDVVRILKQADRIINKAISRTNGNIKHRIKQGQKVIQKSIILFEGTIKRSIQRFDRSFGARIKQANQAIKNRIAQLNQTIKSTSLKTENAIRMFQGTISQLQRTFLTISSSGSLAGLTALVHARRSLLSVQFKATFLKSVSLSVVRSKTIPKILGVFPNVIPARGGISKLVFVFQDFPNYRSEHFSIYLENRKTKKKIKLLLSIPNQAQLHAHFPPGLLMPPGIYRAYIRIYQDKKKTKLYKQQPMPLEIIKKKRVPVSLHYSVHFRNNRFPQQGRKKIVVKQTEQPLNLPLGSFSTKELKQAKIYLRVQSANQKVVLVEGTGNRPIVISGAFGYLLRVEAKEGKSFTQQIKTTISKKKARLLLSKLIQKINSKDFQTRQIAQNMKKTFQSLFMAVKTSHEQSITFVKYKERKKAYLTLETYYTR